MYIYHILKQGVVKTFEIITRKQKYYNESRPVCRSRLLGSRRSRDPFSHHTCRDPTLSIPYKERYGCQMRRRPSRHTARTRVELKPHCESNEDSTMVQTETSQQRGRTRDPVRAPIVEATVVST